MCRRLGWNSRRRKKKKKSTEALEDGKEAFVCKRKEAKKKGTHAGIADFSFLPLLKGNNAWLSNQSQVLCHKSSHMRGTMTPSSLRSHSFLHAFLFWGVLMNDLKSDLFPSLGCLEGRWLAGGGVWRGEVDPDVKVSRLSGCFAVLLVKPQTQITCISFTRPTATHFVFVKQDQFSPRVKDTWCVRRWLCEPENNI